MKFMLEWHLTAHISFPFVIHVLRREFLLFTSVVFQNDFWFQVFKMSFQFWSWIINLGWRIGWCVVHDPNDIFKGRLTSGIKKLTTRLVGPNKLIQVQFVNHNKKLTNISKGSASQNPLDPEFMAQRAKQKAWGSCASFLRRHPAGSRTDPNHALRIYLHDGENWLFATREFHRRLNLLPGPSFPEIGFRSTWKLFRSIRFFPTRHNDTSG